MIIIDETPELIKKWEPKQEFVELDMILMQCRNPKWQEERQKQSQKRFQDWMTEREL